MNAERVRGWVSRIQRIASQGYPVLAQPRQPAALLRYETVRDLIGICVILHVVDGWGPCIWRLFFDDRARLVALAREDGTEMADAVAASANLIDYATSIANRELGLLL